MTIIGDQSNGNNLSNIYAYEKSIEVLLPSTSTVELSAVRPDVRVSDGAIVVPDENSEVDFSSGAVVYTVTAPDKVTKTVYNVTVRKNSYKAWSEKFNSDFSAYIDYDDVHEETPVLTKYDTSSEGTYVITSDSTSNKWTLSTGKSYSALYYTKEAIESGAYVLREGESFDPPMDEENNYYFSSTDKTVVSNDEAQSFAVKYVVRKNDDETYSNVLTSDYTLYQDPSDDQNYCLRYDKRGTSVVRAYNEGKKIYEIKKSGYSVNKFLKQIYVPGRTYYKKTDTMSYTFDLNVPRTGESTLEEWGQIALAHNDSSSCSYTLCFRADKNGDLAFALAKSLKKPEPNSTGATQTYYFALGKAVGCANKWTKIDVRIKLDSNGSNPVLHLYADNKLISKTDKVTNAMKVYFGGESTNAGGARSLMTLGTSSTTAKLTFYLDNIELNNLVY